ncbi:hypothetical protein [Rhizobacter sp. P5_C2]
MKPLPLPETLPRRRRDAPPSAYTRLRAEGLQRLQRSTGERWTDHNLHDPGITLLEHLCFALADLEYRAGFPVHDHLTGPDGRIDHEALSLHRPEAVFPCRATTAPDYRRLLLDAVPGLDEATLTPAGTLAGVHRLTLKLTADHAELPARRIAAARAAWRRERNLCEDLDDAVSQVREQPLELLGAIELAGPRDAVEVLAEVYDRCARFIACAPQGIGLEQALRDGMALEQFFSGPRMQRGRLIHDDGAAGSDVLFLSDLSALVQAIDGVARVRLDALRQPGTVGATSVPWRGPGWAQSLRVPDGSDAGHDFPALSVVRAGSAVAIDPQALRLRYADLRAGDAGLGPRTGIAAPLPQGVHRKPSGYRSVQLDFPVVYGLGREGLPAGASMQTRARVRQFKAYLRLFDQALADGMAQVGHLAALFSIDTGSNRSYWHQDVSGAGEAPFDAPTAAVLDDVHQPFEHPPARKRRALAHLLALHGVTLSQDGMRQFAPHLDADEQDAWLLQNLAAWLRDVVALGRDRAGGFDYSRPLWANSADAEADNTPNLLRRLSLLLGFRNTAARPLARALLPRRLVIVDSAGADAKAPAVSPRPVAPPARAPSVDEWRHDMRRMLPLHGGQLPPALLRAGLRREHYGLVSVGGSAQRLLLGPDENGWWWTLGHYTDAARAARAADSLRRFLLRVEDDCDGLHLVEHLLLRPASATARPAHHLALRLTAVFPAWTSRTRDAAFRSFARETLEAACPAHLVAECRWLSFDEMCRFEDDFAQWAELKQSSCRALDAQGAVPADLVAALDAAAARVEAHIVAPPADLTPTGDRHG